MSDILLLSSRLRKLRSISQLEYKTVEVNAVHTDKKEKKIFLIYIRKFRRDRLQSHIWLATT